MSGRRRVPALYCEMYYDDKSDSINFDTEFAIENQSLRSLMAAKLANINQSSAFQSCKGWLEGTTTMVKLKIPYAPSFRQQNYL